MYLNSDVSRSRQLYSFPANEDLAKEPSKRLNSLPLVTDLTDVATFSIKDTPARLADTIDNFEFGTSRDVEESTFQELRRRRFRR